MGRYPSHKHLAWPRILRRCVQGVSGMALASWVASIITKKSLWRCGSSSCRRATRSTLIARWTSRRDWTIPTVWSSMEWRQVPRAVLCSSPSSLADEAHNTAIAAIASPECAREVQLHSGDREGNRVHPFLRLCASRYKSTVQTGGLKTSWITSWSKTDMSRSLILDWLARCSRSRLLWRSLARRCCRDLEKTRD